MCQTKQKSEPQLAPGVNVVPDNKFALTAKLPLGDRASASVAPLLPGFGSVAPMLGAILQLKVNKNEQQQQQYK
jgi:hypothetical protein